MKRITHMMAWWAVLMFIAAAGCSNEQPGFPPDRSSTAPAGEPGTQHPSEPGAGSPGNTAQPRGVNSDVDPDPGQGEQPVANVGRFERAMTGTLRFPVRLATAADGTIFVADSKTHRVAGYRSGRLVTVISGLDKPLGLAVSNGFLFVGSVGRGSVEVYNLASQRYAYSLGAGEGAFTMPASIAVAPDGVVYVADSREDVIKVFGPDGTLRSTIGERGKQAGQLRFPAAVAVDATRVVVGDQGNHRIQIFGRGGELIQAFGEPIPTEIASTDEFAGRFTRIQGVTLSNDRIYVLDSYHAHIQIFDFNGESLGFVGRRGHCPTCLSLALDVAVDRSGVSGSPDDVRLLVADPDNRRWVTLSTAGEVAP